MHGATVGDPVAFSAMQPRCIPALSLLPATREKKELLSTEFKKTVIDDLNRVRFSDGVLFFYFVLLIWNINSITIKKQYNEEINPVTDNHYGHICVVA